MPTNRPETNEPALPGHVSSTDQLGLVEKAPRWWHCDTHGAGTLNAWGCPDCVAELRRWKSTNAPRLEALQGLLIAAQNEAHAGREAVTSLASERAANAMLTDEIERLQARDALWRQAVTLGHLYAGACPDDEQPDSRDEHCPLCVMLGPNVRAERPQTAQQD